MLAKLRPRSAYDVMAALALFVSLSAGGAYAANEWNSSNIQDETLTGADVRGKNGTSTVKGTNGSLTGADISGQRAIGGSGQPFVNGSLGTWDLQDGSVRGRDVQDNALTSDKILDGEVRNADLAFSSVTSDKISSRSVGASQLALPEGWHYIGDPGEPGFENGWSNYDAGSHDSAVWQHAAFAIDNNNVVHLRGLVKGGTVGAPIFTLPSSYCPWYYHLAPTLAGDAPARLTMTYITPDCRLSVSGAVNNSYVALDPMSYTVYYYEHRIAGASAKALAGGSLGGRRLPTGDAKAGRQGR